jgi:hypothetical protein
VIFYRFSVGGQDDDAWDKVGQAIGNLQALKSLSISSYDGFDDDDDSDDDYDQVVLNPDWKILARILSHVRQNIGINLDVNVLDVEEVQMLTLARAIRGHPTITNFDTNFDFPCRTMDFLYSALATLPALEVITLCYAQLDTRPPDESTLAIPESLTELLRVPSLRSVCFYHSLTPALCQAIANALMEGTVVTNLEFRYCSLSDGECAAVLANGLARNTSVSCITVEWHGNEAINKVLAAALPLNSTLQELLFQVNPSDNDPDTPVDWSQMFLALGKNAGLKFLEVGGFGSMEESLCTAIKDGLELNETLESLELTNVILCDDSATLWYRALSFLRTNRALKSLVVNVQDGVTDSSLSAFHIDIAAMLQDSASLENLSIISSNTTRAEGYVAFLTSLQQNLTLKSLNLESGGNRLQLTDDEDKQMAVLIKKKYAMESLPGIDLEKEARDVGAILRLNGAGRRYLIEDGSSISKGVKVLSAVRSDINCVFLHLLENPRLCDRSAVETTSASADNGGLACPVSPIGKREHDRALEEGKESRRRRT